MREDANGPREETASTRCCNQLIGQLKPLQLMDTRNPPLSRYIYIYTPTIETGCNAYFRLVHPSQESFKPVLRQFQITLLRCKRYEWRQSISTSIVVLMTVEWEKLICNMCPKHQKFMPGVTIVDSLGLNRLMSTWPKGWRAPLGSRKGDTCLPLLSPCPVHTGPSIVYRS